MPDTSTQSFAYALAEWTMWFRHWRRTRDPRALQTARAMHFILREKFAIRRADFALDKVLYRARESRTARTQARTLYCAVERALARQAKASTEARHLPRRS